MINIYRISSTLLAVCLGVSTVSAQDTGPKQDARAIEVLKSMSAYTESLNRVVIKGVTFTDARLDAGLMVSNSTEVRVTLERPGSMQISSFDGVMTKGLYFHEGMLTVYNTENGYYAQADIPPEIDAAMEFVLEELGVEAPLMDLIYKDASTNLISSDQSLLYLTDKSRIGDVDCHQIAIRGDEVDVQLWVEEGDRPVTRKIMITSKWEGGTPRFWANLDWDTSPKIKQEVFEFKAPEGATKIEFITESSEQ